MDILKEIFAPVQLIGYAGMLCAFFSFQCKKNRNYFLLQAGCGLFFAWQFAMLGGWSGVLCNVFALFRGIIFARRDKFSGRRYLVGIEAGFVLSLILSITVFAEPLWVVLLLFVAQAGGTLCMWSNNGRTIRIFQFCVSSPIWLIHNTVYAPSLGGVLCETFNMISVVVSFIRFRKTGFEK